MRWEPIAAMIALLLLGVWLVYAPRAHYDLREGAVSQRMEIGSVKGVLEIVPGGPDGAPTYRFVYRDHSPSRVLSSDDVRAMLGDDAFARLAGREGNAMFRLFNISGWTGIVWVSLGLLGQVAFFLRMAVQWLVSEKQQRSVVPPVFWHMSLGGGVLLFLYFVWRQDLVGVLGQTTGIVIYARNIRLIRKQQRRTAPAAAQPA